MINPQYPWLLHNEGPTPQWDMPEGQLVRSPQQMSTPALQYEMGALGSPFGRYGGRGPAAMGGLAAGLGGFPGIGLLMSGMAGAGIKQRMGNLFTENQTRQIAQQFPGAGGGAMASRGLMGGNNYGRSDSDMAQAGLGDWSDETGFGGA